MILTRSSWRVSLFLSSLLLSLLIVSGDAASWKLLDKRLSTLLPGICFTNATSGWVSGFGVSSSAPGPVILATTDGGNTWNNTNIEEGIDSFIYMSVSMAPGGQFGVAGGLGLPTIPGIVVTSDGFNWVRPSFPSFLFEDGYLDVQALDNSTFFAFGEWSELYNPKGEGVQVSTDGKTFNPRNWGQQNGARYGHFINATNGWVAGGNLFPLRPAPYPTPNGITLSHDLHLRHSGIVEKLTNGSGIFEGIIAATQDGGRNWVTQLNTTALGYNSYFNGIHFTDSLNGWVISVYKNETDGVTGSTILYTSNGGKTWSLQLREDHVHLYRIRMLDANNGWAVGFKAPDITLFSGEFYRTTNGGKRWERTTIADTIGLDIAVIDSNTAFATVLGLDFSTNLYKYS